MDIGEQFSLEHLLFKERRCRTCGESKDLISEFYLTRKTKKGHPSAYAYECKDCTVKRVMASRKKRDPFADWGYPDW
jgi:predicted nucleic acid-binding Zn ribbon protein